MKKTNVYFFEVENIDGEIKTTPESMELNKDISLIRITAPDKTTNCNVIFELNDREYDTSNILSAYGFPQYIRDVPIYIGNNDLLIENINKIHFKKMPTNIKLKVELFECSPLNFKRILDLINECGKVKQNPKDLMDADLRALQIYLELGYSVKDAEKALYKVFEPKSDVDKKRYQILKKYIENYEKNNY